ncbi:serine carboxypeptidase-like [Impatiens glandulifera]|uniref:serine carboxypeptidase-like n=1 Tax=Impatiens glandulifera TaxID=253017 RepID=UPI001FB131E9|nr:serine carboxypeptidase-like [Impatiens glandulifera]
MSQRSRLSFLILIPLFFFSCPILSSSSLRTSNVNSTSTEAERLIQSLNLFPSSGVNSGGGGGGNSSQQRLPNAAWSSLVETRFHLQAHGNPGIPIQNLGHHAGYYRLPNTYDARMFYYFFESRKSKRSDPVVMWLNGGPGCSSSIGLFYENGPYQIRRDSLYWNEFGWDQVSNMIYVDQPTGTGFSYSSHQSDIRNDGEDVSNDLYHFLQEFFQEHPQYLRNDFYIAGESYAGHYIPALATRIHNGNNNRDGSHINLKGIAIGNGLVNPEIQYKSFPDYALSANLITESQARYVSELIPTCERNIARCNARRGGEGNSCLEAHISCTAIFKRVLIYFGSMRNYYDTRKQCAGQRRCYDFSYIESLLNSESVRNALGVGNIRFVSVSQIVYNAMLKDWMRNYAVEIPSLLQNGIKVLIYAGEYDLICNWLGIYRWVEDMQWYGQRQYNHASLVSYEVDGSTKGEIKEYGPLTFLKILNAGHYVPMDQPKVTLKMLKRWTRA